MRLITATNCIASWSCKKILGISQISGESLVAFRRIQGGELFERVIDEDFVLTERACACFMKQICEAMEYIHSNKIIHLDMKVKVNLFRITEFFTDTLSLQPENVLCLSKSGNRIKLIDFGFARRYDPNKKLQV